MLRKALLDTTSESLSNSSLVFTSSDNTDAIPQENFAGKSWRRGLCVDSTHSNGHILKERTSSCFYGGGVEFVAPCSQVGLKHKEDPIPLLCESSLAISPYLGALPASHHCVERRPLHRAPPPFTATRIPSSPFTPFVSAPERHLRPPQTSCCFQCFNERWLCPFS